MQHSAMIEKGGTVVVFSKSSTTDMPEVKVWKFTYDNEFIELTGTNFVIMKLSDDYYKCGFVAPDEDCYLCIKFANDVEFVRVGEPKLTLFHHTNEHIGDRILEFQQIDAADGHIIAFGDLTSLQEGFYYTSIRSNDYSLIEISLEGEYKTISVLKTPYPGSMITPNISGEGFTAVENFVEIEKLAMLGFLGDRKSSFDKTLGMWVDKDEDARASDLARAIAHRYSLTWSKSEDETRWIGNYVKYIKTQAIDGTGSALVYRPGSTPDSNKNNFTLIGDDPLGNTIVRGLAIYVIKPLETIYGGLEGAVFEFRNKE